MSWIPADYLLDKIKNRRFNWLASTQLKYLDIRIDTRDDHAILLDRHGKVVATTVEQLDTLFDELNAKADRNSIFEREAINNLMKKLKA